MQRIPDSFFDYYFNGCVFFFGLLMLVMPNGYAYGSFAALLLLFLLPFTARRFREPLTKRHWIVIAVFASYAFITFISVCIYDYHPQLRNFDGPSRVFLGLAIFWLAIQLRPSFNAIVYGIALGAIGAGLIACYQKFYLGEARALGTFAFVIEAGDISMAMGIMSLAFSFYFYRQRCYRSFMLCLLATLMGVLGSLLSGSRGGWICSPFIILFYLWRSRHLLSVRLRLLALCVVLLFSGALFLPQFGVIQRVQQAQSDIINYRDGANSDTSVGIRFQLWYSAWHSFLDKPLFGWGENGVNISKEQQMQQGLITPFIAHFDSHAHNEYLDEMAKRGIIGLLMLLANFLVPLTLFRRVVHEVGEADKRGCMAMAGCFLVINCMDFCLTQAFYQHVVGVMFYFPLTAILLAYCLNQRRAAPLKVVA